MNNVIIRVGDDRLVIDKKEIAPQSLNFLLKDINNFGKRNASYTKPVSVLQTENTDRIFKALFNINVTGGFDPSQKEYAEIEENGLRVMKGSMQVNEITESTYEVTIFTNNLSLFREMGDKLIVGNQNPADDVSLGTTAYAHNWSRDVVRNWMNIDASHNGEGYAYAFTAWDQFFTWPLFSFNNYYLKAYSIPDDYPVLPHLAVRQVFDEVFDKYGYSYEITAEASTLMNELYFEFNADWLDLTADVSKYGVYYLGNPDAYAYTDEAVELTQYAYPVTFLSTEVQPAFSVKGWVFESSYLSAPYQVSGGYDDIFSYPSDASAGSDGFFSLLEGQRFPIPHAGTFILDVSMYLYNTDAGDPGDTEWSITTWNTNDGLVTTQIADTLTIPAASGAYLNGTISLSVSQKSFYYVHRSSEASPLIDLVFGPWSKIEISEVNSLIGKSPLIDLDDLRPKNYKQKDLINDILTMFNAYVQVDEGNEKKLIIKTYTDFYSDAVYKDWSDKISQPKHTPLKNTFASVTNFKFTDDSDVYTQDYKAKFPDGIYTHYTENDSEFGAGPNDIVLNVSPGTLATVPNSDQGYGTINAPLYNPPIDGVPVLTISDDKQFKTAWRPRILFLNTIDISAFPYGSDRYNISDPSINKWHTLSPRRDASVGAGGINLFLGWDSENTYLNIPEESNETIYNRYYKDDIESNLDDDARMLTCKANLNANDIQSGNWNDKIWIDHWKIGSGYYFLNSIKNYVPGSGNLCEIELLKIPIIDASYAQTRSTNVVYRTVFGESSSASGATGGGSGGGGTSGDDLQAVTTSGNITNQGIVFENISVSASQVEVNVDGDDNLTIDGGLEVNETINVTKDVSIGQDLYVDEGAFIVLDTSIGGDLNVTGDTFTTDLTASANIKGNNVAIIEDISIGDTLFGDTMTGETPFVSGWTGDGWRLYEDEDSDTNLEVDNLRVRGSMEVYELILNKIRATNGSLWVSDAVEAQWPGDASTRQKAGLYYDSTEGYHYFRVEENLNTLQTGDAILSQQFLGNQIHKKEWWVQDSSGTYVYVYDDVSVYDRNDGAGPDDTTTTPNQSMMQGTADTWGDASDPPGIGYDFSMDEDDYFFFWTTINGDGKFKIGGDRDNGGAGSVSIEIYDANDNLINSGLSIGLATTGTWSSTRTISGNTTPGDPSCYVRFVGGPYASDEHDGFYINVLEDYTMDTLTDITGYTFVRMGNPIDDDRQGSLYLTASDAESPYMEVLDGMVDHDKSGKQKVRLGNLDGLQFLDASIGGYGLWSDNVYLTGGIFSPFGEIGGWTITNNNLSAEVDQRSIILDAAGNQITLFDASNNLRTLIHNNDIRHIDDIQATSEINYTGAAAQQYTDQTLSSNGTSYSQTLVDTYYIHNRNALTNSQLEMATSQDPSIYDIQFAGGQAHSRVYWTLALDYDLSTNSDTRTYPATPGATAEVRTVTLAGNYTFNTKIELYDGSSNLVGTDTWTTPTGYTSGFTGQEVFYIGLTNWDHGAINGRWVADVSIKHGLYQNIKRTIYVWEEVWPGDYNWVPIYDYTQSYPLQVDYDMEIYRAYINGEYNMTEIGRDGLTVYQDGNYYWQMGDVDGVGPDPRTRFVECAGGLTSNRGPWTFNVYDGGDVKIYDGINTTAPTLGGVLAVKDDDSGYVVTIQNEGDTNLNRGLNIRCGQDTPLTDNVCILGEDGNGTDTWSITNDNGGGGSFNDLSDTRFKRDIQDFSFDPLEILKATKPKEYYFKERNKGIPIENGRRIGAKKYGYIAQDCSTAFPEFVSYLEDKDVWMIKPMKMIPLLHETILRQQEKIEELEVRLEKLEKI